MLALVALFYIFFCVLGALGYDASRSDNVVAYWGQNSYGATHSADLANSQQNLSSYCSGDTIDVLPVAFLSAFFSGPSNMPALDLSNICSTVSQPALNGTDLPDCSFLAQDIKTCQDKGKLVTLSLGGASGAATFTDDSQAKTFADTIWNIFLGGSSNIRPFGDAVLDGVDLDIEGGSSTGFAAFVTQLRSHFASADKSYIVTAAPQCPFPDAYLGEVLNSVPVDAVYVQFYNNYCGVQNYDNANAWNFDQWDTWASTQAPNKDVKVFLGVPASPTAAGSGYVTPGTLAQIVTETRAKYASFGGVMYWDASQAYGNARFDQAVKSALAGGTGPASSSSSTGSTTTRTASSSKTTTISSTITGSGSATSSTAVSTSSTTTLSTSTTTLSTSIPSSTSTSVSSATSTPVDTVASSPTGSDPFSVVTAIPANSSPAGSASSPSPASSPSSDDDSSTTATPASTTSSASSTSTSTAGGSGCSSAAWDSDAVYVGGQSVTYQGHAYTAKWWTQDETPGASSEVWKDGGACNSSKRMEKKRMVRRSRLFRF